MKSKKNDLGIIFPACVCERAGFTDDAVLELHVTEGVFVFLKDKMTVLEVVAAIEGLNTLASELMVTLAAACGVCNHCTDEDSTDGTDIGRYQKNPVEGVAGCSLCHDLLDEKSGICIPDYILEEAGIPADARLDAFIDGESGAITVVEAEIQQDIKDVPPGILSVLAASGVCLAELDELILQNGIVYGR